MQHALVTRSEAVATQLKRPVGKRDWASVSSGYLPSAETYEDRRLKAFKESTSRSRYALESVVGWTADSSVVLVTESAGSGSDYRLVAYEWRSGKPKQLYQMSVSAFGRITPVQDATVTAAPAATIKQFIGYRTKGTAPKGVTMAGDFVTFESSLADGGAKRFTEKVSCRVAQVHNGALAWQVETQGGAMVVAAVSCRTELTGRNGWRVRHMDWDRRITGDNRYFSHVTCDNAFAMTQTVTATGNRQWNSPQEQPLHVCVAR